MKVIFASLLISVLVVWEISGQFHHHHHDHHHNHYHNPSAHGQFNNELNNTFNDYKRELQALFDTLQSGVQGNYDKGKVEESLSASKLCSDQIAMTTLNSKSLESSMQSNIDQLEKKLQDTVDQLLHINKTCKCRSALRENFQKIGDKLYHFENKSKLNWFAANKRCQKLGAHLSSLQDEDELEKLRGNLTETEYWLGINDLAIPNTEQSRKGESHCVKLQRSGSDYAMSTHACRLQLNFICEKIPSDDCQDSSEDCLAFR